MNQAIPGTVIFLGALALLGWWLWCQQQRAAMLPPHPANADGYWQTPYYLRANTPVFDGSQAIVPGLADASWALATYYGGVNG